MKKLFVAAAALALLVPAFAQEKTIKKVEKTATETKKKVETVEKKQPVKKEVKKKEVKKVLSKKVDGNAAPTVEKLIEKPNVIATESPETKVISAPVPATVDRHDAPPPPPAPLADPNKDFEFKNDAYDFGKIPAGKPAKYELYIKNISNETQELTLVQPGCGCTTPEYQQGQKIAPGESAKVVLGFNGGAPGNGAPFSKSVTVTLKGHNPKMVTFKGETYAVPTESAPANNATEKLKP